MITLSIVVPCYNEEMVLKETTFQLLNLLNRLIAANKISQESRIYYVDDGSKDNTWNLIENIINENERVGGIKLSRNCGHQNALLAGLFTVPGDAVISLDADLQDDVTAMEKMVDEHLKGAEIVYGVRDDRSTDSFLKRNTAQGFYKLLSIMGVKIIKNHADYRLLSRRAVDELKNFSEVNLFLRGIIPLLGLKSAIVYYKRGQRFAGETKYPLRRMLSFAWEGITSFSVAPLRMITVLGFIIFILTLLMSFGVVIVKIFSDNVVPGWASTVLPAYFLGGIQIFCIGILGEYISKVYKEVKNRPRYLIERTINL